MSNKLDYTEALSNLQPNETISASGRPDSPDLDRNVNFLAGASIRSK